MSASVFSHVGGLCTESLACRYKTACFIFRVIPSANAFQTREPKIPKCG